MPNPKPRYTPEEIQKLRAMFDSQLITAAAILLNGPTKSGQKIEDAAETVVELRDVVLEILIDEMTD